MLSTIPVFCLFLYEFSDNMLLCHNSPPPSSFLSKSQEDINQMETFIVVEGVNTSLPGPIPSCYCKPHAFYCSVCFFMPEGRERSIGNRQIVFYYLFLHERAKETNSVRSGQKPPKGLLHMQGALWHSSCYGF